MRFPRYQKLLLFSLLESSFGGREKEKQVVQLMKQEISSNIITTITSATYRDSPSLKLIL